jgi:hypothetical protein
MITSKHLVTDVTLYEESYRKGFSEFYGNIEDYVVCFASLLSGTRGFILNLHGEGFN